MLSDTDMLDVANFVTRFGMRSIFRCEAFREIQMEETHAEGNALDGSQSRAHRAARESLRKR